MQVGANIVNQLGGLVRDMSRSSAQGIMGANANGVSAAAQSAQGQFNQNSANIANAIGNERIAEQYAFNSGQAASADDFTLSMWNRAAAWNREQMELAMQYNSQEAEKQRAWQEQMRATQYQTAVKDMEAAGLNPILAATSGIGGSGVPSGASGSISGASMSGAQGAMASGGLLNGEKANMSNYTGQLEYVGGLLGLLSSVFGGFSSALTSMSNAPNGMVGLMEKMLDKLGVSGIEQSLNTDKQKSSRDRDLEINGNINRYNRTGQAYFRYNKTK